MICEKYKFVNIHIKKCGGRSLAALFTDLEDFHSTFIDYYRVLQDNIQDYFLWTTVRNPWDRLVSLYAYQRDETGLFVGTFEEFVKEIYFKTNLRFYPENERYPYEALPQLDYLKDGLDNIAVDFITYLPNISKDFEHVKKICNLPQDMIYPHYWLTHKGDYRSYYNFNLKEMVYNLYRKEIDFFGFDFDDLYKFKYPLPPEKQSLWRKNLIYNKKFL